MGYSMSTWRTSRAAGPAARFHFVRRELGVEAFGINWIDLPPGAEGFEHDESESQQEEVNVVVRGSGVYRIEGEDIPVRGRARSTLRSRRRHGCRSPGPTG